MRRRGGNRRRE
jgi:hypothetical protein